MKEREQLIIDMTNHTTIDGLEALFDRLQAAVLPEMLRYEREFFWIATGILLWGAFWQAAEQHQHIPHAQTLAWTCVLVAIWIAYNF